MLSEFNNIVDQKVVYEQILKQRYKSGENDTITKYLRSISGKKDKEDKLKLISKLLG